MNAAIELVTKRIQDRSSSLRDAYLSKIHSAVGDGAARAALSCSNLAHGVAACATSEREGLSRSDIPNIAIVSAYNDMLSAHQPFERFPALIKSTAASEGAVAQFAGGVPAMCDGVTQGRDGMDLSLFSRDVIALSTAVALSHDMFDASVYLGVCDKIVPGLLIGALSFGHLPCAFIPAGPMPQGLPNKEKARMREQFAAGEIGREELLSAESASYHSAGTCTFYGTANSNQMLMEFMGLQLPGGSFVNPEDPLRDELTKEAVRTVLKITRHSGSYRPIGEIVDEKAIVNGMIGLLATGGSTNHTIHLIAIAAAAGICINWDDFADLSGVVPLLARIYPNGTADINQFHAVGGIGFVMGQLLDAGLLHADVKTILGHGLDHFRVAPSLVEGQLEWSRTPTSSMDSTILRPASEPFDKEGGLRLVSGNLGRAIVKVSAVDKSNRSIEAPARVFHSQDEFVRAFEEGELATDFVAVVPYQGARANGMPELHKLTPYLGVLQDRGYRVALLTDGRMSGASGRVLAAIHVTPEAADAGLLSAVKDGDCVRIDSDSGALTVEPVDGTLESRLPARRDLSQSHVGTGRELFGAFRDRVSDAESGATIFGRG